MHKIGVDCWLFSWECVLIVLDSSKQPQGHNSELLPLDGSCVLSNNETIVERSQV